MSFSFGRESISLEDILDKVNEANIAARYLNITEIPCVINSPLREDKRPSFGIYSFDGVKVHYTDFATGERGGIFDLLSQMWHIPYDKVLTKIAKDFTSIAGNECPSTRVSNGSTQIVITKKTHPKIEVKIRDWKTYDIKYWESYGISLDWLRYAEVYPISHKFIIKNGKKYTFGADKYSYAYIERKEGNITIKIYQHLIKMDLSGVQVLIVQS